MDQRSLERALDDLGLGPLRYIDRTTSTNDVALSWLEQGAPDSALVVANEQISGRGRGSRKWFTPPGAALAFSLVLKHLPERFMSKNHTLSQTTALGALAVQDALYSECGLRALIKWPNDVLVHGRKLAGILVEADWLGDHLQGIVLGIGVNVSPASVPPQSSLSTPATSVEDAHTLIAQETSAEPRRVDREKLLHAVLKSLLKWRVKLGQPELIHEWEIRLAFKGEWVQIRSAGSQSTVQEGRIIGLGQDGSLRLIDRNGVESSITTGDLNLRPAKGRHIQT
jgi:BirA family biotin operon repressor/biotin-[acetyl-CoA-carboxylase] ligase